MGEEGEKVCPLCTEVMDMTDQQLKPCKCGYQICVWCWHHIMDMAEKDATEGRCPACRTAYDKEKIVGMTVKCESFGSENNSERRLKPHKGKPKSSDGRKHLTSVRVVQKNLVYVMGLPSNLADEDVLQHKEYFGQYGKVLKVSMSRNAGGAIQYFPNNTCSVYITYSKEDEAIRCIQSVHGFVLEDRPLKACFGTTKYCHAWLRNMPCNNADCLYLHEVGMEEDSFSKDEVVSAYTRSRIQQITGATNNILQRCGDVLPPPVDELFNSGTASEKPIPRSSSNNSSSHTKGSPPDGASEKHVALPPAASWGMRANEYPPITTSDSSVMPSRQNSDLINGSYGAKSVVPGTTKTSILLTDVVKKSIGTKENPVVNPSGKSGLLESSQQPIGKECKTTTFDTPAAVCHDKGAGVATKSNSRNPKQLDRQSSNIVQDRDVDVSKDGTVQGLCSALSSVSIGGSTAVETCTPSDSVADSLQSASCVNDGLEKNCYEQYSKPFVGEPVTSHASVETTTASSSFCIPTNRGSELLTRSSEAQENMDRDNLEVSEVGYSLDLPNSSDLLERLSHSNEPRWSSNSDYIVDHRSMGIKDVEALHPSRPSDLLLSNGYSGNRIHSSVQQGRTSDYSRVPPKVVGGFNYESADVLGNNTTDMQESSIISNILSMDIDPWDIAFDHGYLKTPSSRKLQVSNQSRFSFAREDNLVNQGPYLEPSLSTNSFQSPIIDRDAYFEKSQRNFSSSVLEESDTFPRSFSINSPVQRAPISAPPGFSVPSRTAPPGFSSQDRVDQAFNATTLNQFLEKSLRNQYRGSSAGNVGSMGGIEFIDPAIMAVGKGMIPNGISNSELDMKSAISAQNDARLHLLMQQSMSAQQNMKYPNQIGDRFSHLSDTYGFPARNTDQPTFSQSPIQSRNSYASNGLWDSWNDFGHGNDHVISELLRSETLGLNSYRPGRGDEQQLKYQIPSSGDLINREFGMRF